MAAGHRQAGRLRSALGSRLGLVAGACSESRLQPQSLLVQVPLVLELFRRPDDEHRHALSRCDSMGAGAGGAAVGGGMGGKFAIDDDREVPDTMETIWQYPGSTLVTFSQHNANGSASNPRGWDIEFQGTKGTMGITSRGYEIVPEPVSQRTKFQRSRRYRRSLAQRSRKEIKRDPAGRSIGVGRHDCPCSQLSRLREEPEKNGVPDCGGTSSTSATLLANISLRCGRQLQWDGASETIANDAEASQMLSYEYRSPWRLA